MAQGQDQLNRRYISNLNICREFLQRIRTVLTGQTMDTTIIMKQSNGSAYQIDARKLTGTQLQYTLSGFGSSPLNLTYKLNVNIEKLIQEGIAVKISDTDIYNAIWSQKEPYLKEYKDPNKKYKLVFNSKDAEIFVILANEMSKGNELNLDVERYHDLRAMTGSRNRTSQFQGGDSGLGQVKLVTGQKGAVTLASHSVIRNNLVNLINATNPSKTKEEMMQGLKAMYLNSSKKQELENGINKETQELMQQAETYMRNLFTGTTSINTSKI